MRWPYVSLMPLKSSTSKRTTADAVVRRDVTLGLFEEEAARGDAGQLILIGDVAPLAGVGVERALARQDAPRRRNLGHDFDFGASLGQEIVVAEGERGDFDGELVVRRQHHRVQSARGRIRREPAAISSRPSFLGISKSEMSRSKSPVGRQLQCLDAVRGGGDVEAETPGDRGKPDAEVFVVFGDEHADRLPSGLRRKVVTAAEGRSSRGGSKHSS